MGYRPLLVQEPTNSGTHCPVTRHGMRHLTLTCLKLRHPSCLVYSPGGAQGRRYRFCVGDSLPRPTGWGYQVGGSPENVRLSLINAIDLIRDQLKLTYSKSKLCDI